MPQGDVGALFLAVESWIQHHETAEGSIQNTAD